MNMTDAEVRAKLLSLIETEKSTEKQLSAWDQVKVCISLSLSLSFLFRLSCTARAHARTHTLMLFHVVMNSCLELAVDHPSLLLIMGRADAAFPPPPGRRHQVHQQQQQ
jgi:hypothetical protein